MINDAVDRATPMPESSIPVVPGQIIGDRYRIGEILGEGGMGVVCAATHLGLGTPVAIKLIRSDLMNDPESVLRFLNEGRTAASLKGEHIARVHDVGQLESGEPYLVMEQLEGIGLDDFIREQGPLSQGDAVDIVLQACEGLAEAHAVSLVHRDIKPANLFLTRRPDGQRVLKILDFGISKRLVSARQGLTAPGTSLGSPWYMSPEQMMSASLVDQRADVWSLGVLLFELLTKEYPFVGESVPQVCASVLTAPAPLPSALRPDIDAGLDAVVLGCLEKDPEKRYASVVALAEAIRPFASRSVEGPALAFGDTQPVDGAQPKGRRARRFESLAPVFSHIRLPRSRWSWMTTLMAVLAGSAVLTGFGWPYAQQHYGAPGWAELSRSQLPWDPLLGPGPLDEPPIERGDSPSPPLLRTTTLAAPVPNEILIVAGSLSNAMAAPGPTPAESRLRTARYETWLRDQGLTRISKVPADSEESLHDEP